MKPLLVFLLVFALFCVAFVLQAQTLEGTVTDIYGTPVPGAFISTADSSYITTSGPVGTYSLAGLPAGQYTVIIHADAMISARHAVELRADQKMRLDVKLERECSREPASLPARQNVPAPTPNHGNLTGTVRDEDGPIPGARIEIQGTNRGAVSGPDGSYFIVGLPTGIATVRITSLGKEPVEHSVSIPDLGTDTLDIQLVDNTNVDAEIRILSSVVRIEAQLTEKESQADSEPAASSRQGNTDEQVLTHTDYGEVPPSGFAPTPNHGNLTGTTVQHISGDYLRTSTVSGSYGIRGGRASEASIRRDGIEIERLGPPAGNGANQPASSEQIILTDQRFSGNMFRDARHSPYSTFSIDVDNASYTNIRGYLTRGEMPPPDAVRIEELINYFSYNYPQPEGDHPLAFDSEVAACPWNPDHRIVRLALQGRELHPEQAPPSNLVFLIDVSGSMNSTTKLPLLKQGLIKLVEKLRPQDRASIVVYAGAAGLVLPPTSGEYKATIICAINRLQSGGSTAGGAGIQLAYSTARENFLPDGNNRVILATDGDFNVGISDQKGLVELIEKERESGVFLSVLGFGHGNYQDEKMEQLADNGNGNYYYIDRLQEAERVLVSEMSGTLHTIAKDVKLQIRFNPDIVAAYRLIGYENRVLAAKDFDDDTRDAGELGAGHQVTALYEIVPVGQAVGYDVDSSKGQEYRIDEERPELLTASDLMLVRLRYKKPTASESKLIEHIVQNRVHDHAQTGSETRFAMAVAQWGMLIRNSKYAGNGTFESAMNLIPTEAESPESTERKEFAELIETARKVAGMRVEHTP